MIGRPDPTLTAWAAACAEHALAQFADEPDARARAAVAAAREWSTGPSSADASRDAAFEAHLAARDLQDDGYRAAAAVVRAAGNAAASVDDPQLARTAADYAIEALTLNSAPCELQFNAAAERRWQWTALPTDRRAEVFEVEPPEPEPAACAIDLG